MFSSFENSISWKPNNWWKNAYASLQKYSTYTSSHAEYHHCAHSKAIMDDYQVSIRQRSQVVMMSYSAETHASPNETFSVQRNVKMSVDPKQLRNMQIS